MTSPRIARARQSEAFVAEYLSDVFPGCHRVPASLPGVDIVGTPGWAIEVKARRDLSLPAWLKQSAGNAHEETPLLIVRPDGYGPERIGQWAAVLLLSDIRTIMSQRRWADEDVQVRLPMRLS